MLIELSSRCRSGLYIINNEDLLKQYQPLYDGVVVLIPMAGNPYWDSKYSKRHK